MKNSLWPHGFLPTCFSRHTAPTPLASEPPPPPQPHFPATGTQAPEGSCSVSSMPRRDEQEPQPTHGDEAAPARSEPLSGTPRASAACLLLQLNFTHTDSCASHRQPGAWRAEHSAL